MLRVCFRLQMHVYACVNWCVFLFFCVCVCMFLAYTFDWLLMRLASVNALYRVLISY